MLSVEKSQPEPSTPRHTQPEQAFSFSSLLRTILPTLLIDGGLTFLAYTLLKNTAHMSETLALILSSIIPLAHALLTLLLRRRIDIVAIMILLGILGSVIPVFFGSSPKLLLIRESFISLLIGIAFLVTLFTPRPMLFLIARQLSTGNDPQRVATFEQGWQKPYVRHAYRMLTTLWGVLTIGDFLLRVLMVTFLSVPQVLALSPIVTTLLYVALMALTFYYAKADERQKKQES